MEALLAELAREPSRTTWWILFILLAVAVVTTLQRRALAAEVPAEQDHGQAEHGNKLTTRISR